MCGVAGIIDYQGKSNNKFILSSMLRDIRYRGPDESGIYNSRFATLGNVRLSIIDIEEGQQPLSDTSGRFWIVFNGEIFNYLELRNDLEKKGHIFRTKSDTEVLVQMYVQYGAKCLEFLNGQFAFAIWDKYEEKLFFARDRIGICPFYYNVTNGVLTFASEIKALFRQRDIKRELSPESLSQIFTFWSAISQESVFKGIFELAPGHFATFNRQGLKIERYWELNFDSVDPNISIEDALGNFNELFTSSVRLRLRADVQVAAYLSGGIDSSAIVRYIKNIEPGVLNTFSIGFDESDFDESYYQKEASEYFRTDHRSVKCSSSDIAEYFPKAIWHTETPVLRTAPVPMLILSELVRKNNIKVVITGEGSDELLAGYDIFKEEKIRRFWASLPDSKVRPLLLKKIYNDIPHLRNASSNVLKFFFGYKLEDIDNPYYSHLLRWNNSGQIKKHFSSRLKEDLKNYSPFYDLETKLPENFNSWENLAKSQWLETNIFMSGYLLSSQGDRMAMANSVEGRYPFLDYRLIEFCNTLPSDFKLHGLKEKYLLKKLLKNKIPESIINRPKQPYRAPTKNVFFSTKRSEYVELMLSDTYTKKTNIFNYESLSSLLSRIEKTGISSEVDNMIITSVISTHILNYQFIDDHNEEFQKGALNNLKITDDL